MDSIQTPVYLADLKEAFNLVAHGVHKHRHYEYRFRQLIRSVLLNTDYIDLSLVDIRDVWAGLIAVLEGMDRVYQERFYFDRQIDDIEKFKISLPVSHICDYEYSYEVFNLKECIDAISDYWSSTEQHGVPLSSFGWERDKNFRESLRRNNVYSG